MKLQRRIETTSSVPAIQFLLYLFFLLSEAFDNGDEKSVLHMCCRFHQRFRVVYCEIYAKTNQKLMRFPVKTS